jgi:signal transduction histidine kinase
MNNISIKKKLLFYSFLIQLIILIVFSFSLYKALELSNLDKIQTTLKVITLDIVDDVLEDKNNLSHKIFNEEKEYKFEPLFIKLLKIDNKIIEIASTKFPSSIKDNLENIKKLKKEHITFEIQEPYIISKIKISINSKDYLLKVATNHIYTDSSLENLLYILIFIVPIILILSTIGGYFLIYKSFLPIEKILKDLKDINATDLSKRLELLNINNDEIELLTNEINSLLSRLEISFEKISQFSSDASHELKTPLTIIRGEIEIALRKERTKNDYKDVLKNCLDEVFVIQETTDNLLFLAKTQEQFELTNEEVYVDELSSEVIKELEPYAKLKSVKINHKIFQASSIKGNHQLLKIAIKNILKNAITFSHKNSIVTLTNHTKNNSIFLSIEDKGIGIPKVEQHKVFENFYRTDKSRNKDSGGTGLGMAICKKIIDIHESSILLKSEENIGTIVTFKFTKYLEDMETI